MSGIEGKRSILPEQEKKFSEKLNGCYEFLSAGFSWMTLICLFVALVLDFIPFPYCCTAVENFFCNRDASPLVSVSLVIWTFGATLMVYFMGRMEDRRFGVRFYEVMLAHERKVDLVKKILLFLAEIFLLEFCAAYGQPITLFVVCMLQPANIVYFFLMITQETSLERMIQTINSQTEAMLERLVDQQKQLAEQPDVMLGKLAEAFETERKDWLLLKVLRGIDYNKHEDLDDLLACLRVDQWESARNYPEVLLVVSWYLAYCMLDGSRSSVGGQKMLSPALTVMFKEIVSNPHCSGYIKFGIITALPINRESPDHDELFLSLLALTHPVHQGIVVEWTSYFLEKLVNSGEEDFAWRDTLLNNVNDLKAKDCFSLSDPGMNLIDRYLAWLGYTEAENEDSEDSSEADLEKEVAGYV